MKNVLDYFNNKMRQALVKEFDCEIFEIRLRVNQPLIVYKKDGEHILQQCVVTPKDIDDTFNIATDYSAFAYEENIKEGYLTLPGGHRMGVGGYITKNLDGESVIKNIRYINFRVKNIVTGCSNKIIDKIINENQSIINNTLIISPPGFGKTTLLRDIIKSVSENVVGTCICVIDERNEIGGCLNGIPTFDLGKRTDIISNSSKAKGIIMAIRTMGPKILAVDEIGNKNDIEAIKYASISGVSVIATIHGTTIGDIRQKIGDEVLNMFKTKIVIKKIGEYEWF